MYRSGISMELWKKWKDLYDYIKNKDDIQNIINSDRELCKIYPKYHTYITGIYETYKKECCEVYNGNCPYELNFKEWCHKEDLFTKLKCNDSEVVTTYTAQPGIYNSEQLETADGLLAKQETEERDGRVQVFLEEGTTRSPKPQEEEREQRGSSGTEEETVEAGREEPESSFGAGRLIDSDNLVAGPIGDPSESILPKNTGTIGATLAGSSLFLLMMYKYTPLGSWVSTKILGRNKLMENMRKNNYELLLNDVGNHEASINDPMYHIRYNSATSH